MSTVFTEAVTGLPNESMYILCAQNRYNFGNGTQLRNLSAAGKRNIP